MLALKAPHKPLSDVMMTMRAFFTSAGLHIQYAHIAPGCIAAIFSSMLPILMAYGRICRWHPAPGAALVALTIFMALRSAAYWLRW